MYLPCSRSRRLQSMNHEKRSTVVGGGDMKRATSGAVSTGSRWEASSGCSSRSTQCSPVSTGTASRQDTGGAPVGSWLGAGVATAERK